MEILCQPALSYTVGISHMWLLGIPRPCQGLIPLVFIQMDICISKATLTGSAHGVQIKDPNPTVYQLRSPESSDTSVCLFTDFDSEVQLTKITGSKWNMMHKTNSTALDMEILGSKSNGIVTWGNTSDAGCKDTFSEDILVAPSDGIACNAKLVEKSFETDMNLNSQNLSVIGFRILLLKVVGFNLLMTLRLWSS
ncbi:hypothetical protein FD754_019056 [Muntiacus muntjak]|uniref:T-cell receptor alpha chain constant domain-containing protein n=1 Tax=Muntiacus muntjak TaxID=9888 RepID=A0A5N3V0H7_MUNMU|nr:hypothetical protein FD754_019056 [Muntiacus muntjak]